MNKEEILREVGLSKNEAKAYLALLEVGQGTAGDVAKEASVHRANIYDSLERLEEKGLVGHISKGDVKYYSAGNPENLLLNLKEKESKLDQIMPELILKQSMNQEEGQAHVYHGIKSATKLLEGLLKYKERIMVFGIPKDAPEMMKHWTSRFHQKRIPNEIQMDHIYNVKAKDRIEYLNSLSFTGAKYLPEQYDSPVATNICGPEVILILFKKPVFSVRIISQEIADAYKNYFELLWDMAKN